MSGRSRLSLKRRLTIIALVLVLALIMLAGSVRSFVIAGASDAPTLLIDDKVVVNRLAYDLFLPFTEVSIIKWSEPRRGDMVLCRVPEIGGNERMLKRIVAVGGDVVEMRNHRLVVNGEELAHESHDPADFAGVPR